MSTTSLEGLAQVLGESGLKVPGPNFPDTDILNDFLDFTRCYLAEIVQSVVQCSAEQAFHAIQLPATVDPIFGDLSIVLPKLAREVGAEAEALRESILKQFPSNSLFQQPASDGKQLRLFYHTKTLAQILLKFIHDRNELYGIPLASKVNNAKVVIEFSSPNIVTELNGKHFRSTLIGAQLAKAYQAHGWEVVKVNYLGDWGKPIGLLGVGFERFGSKDLLETNTVEHLRDVYNQISKLFEPELAASKKVRDDEKAREEIEASGIFAQRNSYVNLLESGDEAATALARKFRESCIESYIQIYDRLNVQFDEYLGESLVKQDTMQEIENTLKEKGLAQESQGSIVVNLPKSGGKNSAVAIRDRCGSSTYLLRDLASAIERHRQYNFDKMIYVVSNHQRDHFHNMTKILELLEMCELAGKLEYVWFNENSHLPEPAEPGDTLVQVLDRCEEAMAKSLEANGRELAPLLAQTPTPRYLTISALYAQASSAKRGSELKFEIDRLTSAQPGTALHLLNWIARLAGVPTRADSLADEVVENEQKLDDGYAALLRWPALYPNIVRSSFRASEPAILITYLSAITDQLSDIFEDDEEITAESIPDRQLLEAVRIVLSNGTRQLAMSR
ncbi:arginine-tRNA ligase [Verruconis gallopava]|uniref:arginine--tRNA ligase n=1 Tax=Verruconis gallopava TaxID=253628 RepID=A0A0D1XUW1_9PEZI|nr:arginine-tRNA ligase [Verruconis gallopava]KIW06531.1 arginine-tRNA ligase [Verruconis gallopava]